jgi:serine/threonine-protein kinase RsbW
MPILSPLTVPGILDSLKPIRDYVSGATTLAGLDKLPANRLRLAVDEIVTNIIVHGYDEADTKGDIWIEAVIDADRLTITVEDSGPHYDPTQHTMPTEEDLGQPLDTRDIGGLGIYLAVNSIDEFHFERVNNRNRNIFVMYRSPAEQ